MSNRSLVVHVVGARPNFMKAAPVIEALRGRVEQRLVHTGQHYDASLSDVFFRDLAMPQPDRHLGVGSDSHAAQTAQLLVTLEAAYLEFEPSLVVVYGDVTSTMAAALAAAQLQVPSAHVEAGLRSFDMTMPEELNRRICDLVAELLFATSPDAVDNLAREGTPRERVHFVGNPMIDTLLANIGRLDSDNTRSQLGIAGRYAVATFHRPSNVDDPHVAATLVAALRDLAAEIQVVIPLHPRGRRSLEGAGLLAVNNVLVVEPMGYIEFLSLVRGAAIVITDSGGIQEETTVLGIPCLTVRPNTERPITISHGTNRLVSVDDLVGAARLSLRDDRAPATALPPLWDGQAGKRIGDVIVEWLAQQRQS